MTSALDVNVDPHYALCVWAQTYSLCVIMSRNPNRTTYYTPSVISLPCSRCLMILRTHFAAASTSKVYIHDAVHFVCKCAIVIILIFNVYIFSEAFEHFSVRKVKWHLDGVPFWAAARLCRFWVAIPKVYTKWYQTQHDSPWPRVTCGQDLWTRIKCENNYYTKWFSAYWVINHLEQARGLFV